MYFCGILVALAALSSVECGKPSLSDPLGLREESPFKFAIKDYVSGSIWPKPQQQSREEVLYALDPAHFAFENTGEESDVLIAALSRYKDLTFPDANKIPDEKIQLINDLAVKVEQPYQPMSLKMDESYTLVIAAPTSSLTANTVWGALRGLETFSQVVYQNESGSYFVEKNKIVDFPRFHHRGFLVDTSRHFVSVKVICQFLDALAFSKYNVFHWHIVDSDSFPFVSKSYPVLYEKGAFNNKTHIYSPEDVQKVIEYARFRGIRVLPEFDTPGHTASWFSIPGFLTPCYSGGKPNGNFGPVDPTQESNYVFLENFFKEISTVFPDKYFHMGGDEVSFSCWESNPNIIKWMAAHGMAKNFSLLEQYYEQRLLDIVGKLGKQYVIWQEVVDNQVKVQSDTVVNIWKGHGNEWRDEATRVTNKGYDVIISSPWYLNYISYGPDWPTYYKADPQSFNGTKEQKDRMIGGTACMWGEWVDATNLISRTWARGLAVGERLWSSETTTDVTDAYRRIWEHRCRYLRRGLQAENVVESQYCRHEWNP